MTGKELLPLIRSTGRGDRMSENLYKWVKRYHRSHEAMQAAFSQRSILDGKKVLYSAALTMPQQILIGSFDDGWFDGARLTTIIGEGGKAHQFSFPVKGDRIVPLPDWWQGYTDGGKCFMDPEHRLYMDSERWQVSEEGNNRVCAWCGNHRQEKRVEMVEREYWHSVTDLVMRGEGR